MKNYFAPMEGITGYVYRFAHHRYFGGVDRYFAPFITPTQTRKFTPRELNDLLPEHNQGVPLTPQILTNKAEDFLWAAGRLAAMGYGEVNLNLGCPSGTVVSKHRGAGFLADPEELDRFLGQVSEGMDRLGLELSVKTRIGVEDPGEFPALLEVYNRYPLKELIIHPRVRTDYYKNRPNMEAFDLAVRESRNPLCYNGDLFRGRDAAAFHVRYPKVEAVMMGRGILANPALAEAAGAATLTRQRLEPFHAAVLEGYRQAIPGDRNVLFKMKELWAYLGCGFAGGEKSLKKIRKARSMEEYVEAVSRLFDEAALLPEPVFTI